MRLKTFIIVRVVPEIVGLQANVTHNGFYFVSRMIQTLESPESQIVHEMSIIGSNTPLELPNTILLSYLIV